MPIRILETDTGSVCADGKPAKLMVSSVPYIKGCEKCTRMAFAEALERALKESNFKTSEHGG